MKYFGLVEVSNNAYDYDSNQDFASELKSPVLASVIARNRLEAEKLLLLICESLGIVVRNYEVIRVDDDVYSEFIDSLR